MPPNGAEIDIRDIRKIASRRSGMDKGIARDRSSRLSTNFPQKQIASKFLEKNTAVSLGDRLRVQKLPKKQAFLRMRIRCSPVPVLPPSRDRGSRCAEMALSALIFTRPRQSRHPPYFSRHVPSIGRRQLSANQDRDKARKGSIIASTKRNCV